MVLLFVLCILFLLLMFYRFVIGIESVVFESSIIKCECDIKEEVFVFFFVIFMGEDFFFFFS